MTFVCFSNALTSTSLVDMYRLEYPQLRLVRGKHKEAVRLASEAEVLVGFPRSCGDFHPTRNHGVFFNPRTDPCGTGMISLHFSVDFYPWECGIFPYILR